MHWWFLPVQPSLRRCYYYLVTQESSVVQWKRAHKQKKRQMFYDLWKNNIVYLLIKSIKPTVAETIKKLT